MKTQTPAAIRESFGNKIIERRNALGLSQRALAERIGIRTATLIDIELGRPCEINTLLAIIKALNGRIKIEW